MEYLATLGLAELGKAASEFSEADANCFVPSKCFMGLKQLRVARLPLRAVSIGHLAFSDCINLERVELPPYIKVFGQEAFAGCGKLRIARFPSTLSSFYPGVFLNCSSLGKVDLSACRMSGTFNLSAFNGTNLAELRLPEGIESLDNDINAVRGYSANESITQNSIIYFPESFKELDATFFNCHLHFTSTTPPTTGDGYRSYQGERNTIFVPKDCTTAYYNAFGDKNSYKEE